MFTLSGVALPLLQALDLLTPPVEDNRKSRVKVLVRRGTALAKLEMLPEGKLYCKSTILPAHSCFQFRPLNKAKIYSC